MCQMKLVLTRITEPQTSQAIVANGTGDSSAYVVCTIGTNSEQRKFVACATAAALGSGLK